MKKTNRRKNISALELRSLAGRAPHERGSALLIVIGTLALVAVFAAVYVSIGRTDRRAAQSFRTRVEQRDNSIQFSEYLAGVIGEDRLDAYVQYDINGQPFARREVVDLPFTDWTRRSEVQIGNDTEEALLFTPSGRPYRMEGLTSTTDFRVANDPWLSSTTPTYLGDPGDPQTATDTRSFAKALPYNFLYPNAGNYLDQRDWLQISNFAPDGRPVNLFNLRPNGADFAVRDVNQNDVGGFDAEPGFGTSPRASDGRRIRRMSNYLSLLRMTDPDDPYSFLQAFDPRVEGIWIPGQNEPSTAHGIPNDELYNTPAVWTMYQRFMFMPMNQPFVINNRTGSESTWADPDYPPYQYADADGDGFADSRWFELSAARDENAGGAFGQSRDDVEQLFEIGDSRYFIAAKAVDLSSMVNINTATDGLIAPTTEYPMGSSPAEVDLRRLLTMQDQALDYAAVLTPNDAVVPLAMNAAPRPYTARDDLAAARVWNAPERVQDDFQRESQDYQFYQSTINANDASNTDVRIQDANSPSMLIGRYAYSALRRAINSGGTPNTRLFGYDLQSTGAPNAGIADLVQFESDPADGMAPTAQERYEGYESIGRQYAVNPALTTTTAGMFGIDDLSEILTYHGLNDPDFTSRLERVMDGRFNSFIGSTDDPIRTLRMGPMLSNRDLSLDRFGHTRILSYEDMRVSPSVDNQTDLTRIGEVSRNAMALMALTPRKRMTTLSGFVGLSPDDSVEDAAALQELDADSGLTSLPGLIGGGSVSGLYDVYANALATGLRDVSMIGWDTDPSTFADSNYSTLFYGHRGPELGLRVAAHAAVNMKDLADSDGDPTIATLILDATQSPDDLVDYAQNLDDMSVNPENEREYQLFPGIVEGNLLDSVSGTTSSGLPQGRQAVNVYGMEAMPVITEVSMLYAFTDAPTAAGGDTDFSPARPRENPFRPGEIAYPPPGDAVNVTIDTSVIPSNSDYLMQVLAVQLHNPFDRAISLGGKKYNSENPQDFAAGEALTRKYEWDTTNNVIDPDVIDPMTNFHFDYYLEYNGRFFKVAEYLEWYPADGIAGSHFNTDDPNTNPAFDDPSIPNPAASFPLNTGGQLPLTTTGGSFPDFTTRNVVLNPGETRVFYAIADQRFDNVGGIDPAPDDRWTSYLTAWGDLPVSFGNDRNGDGLGEGPDRIGWTGPAEEWVRHQLGVAEGVATTDPVMMMSFDPTTGALLDSGNFERLDQPPLTGLGFDPSRQDNQEVRLWKKVITTGEESTSSEITNSTPRNLIENDMLVDRMQVPASMASDWNGSNVDIQDTWSFPEDYPTPGSRPDQLDARNDNTGITIADWVTIRRADSSTQEEPSVGQVTPWMIRSRQNPLSLQIENRYLDTSSGRLTDATDPEAFFENGSDIVDPEIDPVFKTDYEITETMGEMFNYSRNAGGYAIIQTLALQPYAKSDVVTPYPDLPSSFDDDAGNFSIDKFSTLTLPTTGVANLDPSSGTAVPEVITDADTVRLRPRLTDLLLAWGIGPTYAPNPNRTMATVGLYESLEWMTAGEAMGIALGFDNPMPTGPELVAADAVWADTWDTTGTQPIGVLDDGHLALDRFVPFMNNTIEDPIAFTPGDDIVRGAGVPAALGVLDRARVFDPIARSTDPVNSTPESDLRLALSRPTFGTININTAPVEVLRLLPGLSPSRASYINTNAAGSSPVSEWWGNNFTNTEAAFTGTPAANQLGLLDNPDVAAGIVAYRDRLFAFPNTGAHPGPAGQNLFFSPMRLGPNVDNLQSIAENFISEDPINNPDTFTTVSDRYSMTGIEGIRNTPGFASLGELLAIQLDPELESTDMTAWNNLRNMTMGLYGSDGVAQGIQDESTVVPQIFGTDEVGDTIDDYAEQLAMASGVVNMVSVRSDFYAVWFVVQGYRESDVANLRPEDPLVPSVHKRYVMVVDRSNVVEPGDKPKIVLLKEVPL